MKSYTTEIIIDNNLDEQFIKSKELYSYLEIESKKLQEVANALLIKPKNYNNIINMKTLDVLKTTTLIRGRFSMINDLLEEIKNGVKS